MAKEREEVIIDFLKIEGLKIAQINDCFNFSIDTVLLAFFATINMKVKKIIDLGCGNGAIPLLLSTRSRAEITGLEIQNISVESARKNFELNNISDKVNVIEGDIKEVKKNFEQQICELVVCNPPFFKFDGNFNQIKKAAELHTARHEMNIEFEDIVKAASHLLKNSGYFAIVHRSDRTAELISILKKYKLEPKRTCFCYTRESGESKIVLIECMKNAKEGVKILQPVYTNNKDGSYTEEMESLFKGKNVFV